MRNAPPVDRPLKLEGRDVLFVLIIIAMALLAYRHETNQEYMKMSVDIFIAMFSLRSWAPWRRIKRRPRAAK